MESMVPVLVSGIFFVYERLQFLNKKFKVIVAQKVIFTHPLFLSVFFQSRCVAVKHILGKVLLTSGA